MLPNVSNCQMQAMLLPWFALVSGHFSVDESMGVVGIVPSIHHHTFHNVEGKNLPTLYNNAYILYIYITEEIHLSFCVN